MNLDFITKKEAILVSLITVFALVWTFVVMPLLMQSDWFISQIPPLQYTLFNLGFVIMFIVVIGLPLTYLLKKEVIFTKAVQIGFTSWMGVGFIYDLFEPPYYLNTNGEVLLNVPKALTGTSVDSMLVWVWQHLGVSGPLLFYSVYLVTPIIIVLLMAIILTGKEFLKVFNG